MAEQKLLIPERTDLLVIGGGTAGAALAGIMARDKDCTVTLIEAGPDYGPFNAGRWPPDLLDARRSASDQHDWGHTGIAHPAQSKLVPFHRARVIGGCSSINYCFALLGHPRDYDLWAEQGNPGWGWTSVRPAFERANQSLGVRIPPENELGPFHHAFIEGTTAVGIPRVADLNDSEGIVEVGPVPVNISDRTRWNSAFAYLDPVRGQSNLLVVGDVLVDRIVVQNSEATGVEAIVDGQGHTIAAGRIVLSAGAYGSPAILMRSGIGQSAMLHALGIQPLHELPGVGQHLVDHSLVSVAFQASAKLARRMAEFEAANWLPITNTVLKACSHRCEEAFDLHIIPVCSRDPETDQWGVRLAVGCMAPRSSGSIRLSTSDAADMPAVQHGYLIDPEGHDREVLIDGIELARGIMQQLKRTGWVEEEISPGPQVASRAQLAEFVEQAVGTYFHPACTCRMGPESDPMAVVDAAGKVHGIENLYVCDASIFPNIMRANTNLPTAMVAEHLCRRWSIGRPPEVGLR